MNRTHINLTIYLLFILLVSTINVHAVDAFSDNVDIMGLTLSINRDDISATLQRNYEILGYYDNKQKFTINNVQTAETSTMRRIDVKAKDNPNKNVLSEAYVISLDPTPGSKSILGILRAFAFPNNKRPLVKVLLKSLFDKYGMPSINNYLNSNMYVWIDPPWRNRGAFDTWSPHINLARNLLCNPLLSLDADHLIDRFDDERRFTGHILSGCYVNALNTVSSDDKNNLHRIKTLMELNLVGRSRNGGTNLGDDDEVQGFTLKLTNIDKSAVSLKAFLDAANKKERDLRQQEIKSKENIKTPKF